MSAPEPDVAALSRMLERVAQLVDRVQFPQDLGPVSLSFRDAAGRGHRVVMLRADALRGTEDLTLVGFFGRRRSDVSDAPLYGMDSLLIDELRGHPGIVSYSSLDLAEHESANLVLATSREVLDRWQRTARHHHVARDLAPRHYAAVRIHTGSVPGGVRSGRPPEIASTRALDFLAA